ncbi:MAG: hypothetical protein JWP95_218 [Actinotalea sp.]|nr:hypothetical protein [Actinotalea sp.]
MSRSGGRRTPRGLPRARALLAEPAVQHDRREASADTLSWLVRRVVLLALAVGCPTILVLSVVLGPDDELIRYGYPPLLACLLVYAWVLVRRPDRTVAFSRATLALLDVAWLVGMVVRLRTADPVDAGWHDLFPTTFMGLIIFLVIGYLFFSPRSAVLHAGALTAGALVAGLVGLLARPGGSVHVIDLVRFCITVLVLTLLLHVLSRAKARLPGAVAAALVAADEAHLMRDMAYLDALTGIANRRRLIEELTFQSDRVADEHPVAIVYFDLDRFKVVNDTHGHGMGDEVLVRTAAVATSLVRQTDVVARLGGEEFVIVAPGTDHEAATLLAERLRETLPVELGADPGVPVTASFGVATLLPGEAAADALDRVDLLMYRAKSAGRDRVVSEPG